MQTKSWLLLSGLGALVSSLGAPAYASDDVGHWYINPQGGYAVTDDDRAQRNSAFYGLGIGKHLSEEWSLELNGAVSQHKGFGAAPRVDLSAITVDALRVFNRDGVFAPFITGGVGAIQDDLQPGRNTTNLALQAGFGSIIRLWENSNGSRSFALRPEVKARWDGAKDSGRYLDYLGMLGFQFSFGAPRAVPAAAPVAAAPPVETAPLPPAPPPPPADSDHDGVIDSLDKCPGTPAGVAVDAQGCPLKGSVTLEGVTFELNSATLAASSQRVLDDVADGLRKHPRLRIELQGHTDSSGSDQYNLRLSQKRAESVKSYLLQQGVPSTQLISKGYGESQPVADNSSAEGRARNRRVVMNVLDNPGDVNVKGEGQTAD